MAKHNFSSKRNAIYNTVCNTDSHPSARWVYEKLKPDIPDLSLGTVYRNIALFKKEGTIQVICNVNGEERIDGNTQPHPHFVCNNCGKVFDVGSQNSNSDFTSELNLMGFTVQSSYIICYGFCPECSKKEIH